MRAASEMPTWQIFPAVGGHFRWAVAGGDTPSLPEKPLETLALAEVTPAPSPLPSMADLLRQAPPELLDRGGTSMFRTGSDRAVSVSRNSIQKARSLMEDGVNGGVALTVEEDSHVGEFPMFRTGLGKSVTVRQSSIRKAASVFEGEEASAEVLGAVNNLGVLPIFHTGSGKPVTVRQSSIRKAASLLEGETLEIGLEPAPDLEDRNVGGFPIFHTGLMGNPVTMMQSSIQKAAGVREGETAQRAAMRNLNGTAGNECIPMFSTGLGRSVTLKESSLRKAASVLGENLEHAITNFKGTAVLECMPMFSTGSGKSFSLKESSVRKAASVLGGENLVQDNKCEYRVDGEQSFSDSLFQTGSGRMVNISSAGLSRATTLLGLDATRDLPPSKRFNHLMDELDTNTKTRLKKSHDIARWNVKHGTDKTSCANPVDIQLVQRNSYTCSKESYSIRNQSSEDLLQNSLSFELCGNGYAQPPSKFNTAGGRSISISSDALQRARKLLGDSETGVPCADAKADIPVTSIPEHEKVLEDVSWNKENLSFARRSSAWSKHGSKMLPLMGSLSSSKQMSSLGVGRLKMIPECRPCRGPLSEIPNNISAEYSTMYQNSSEKKRLGRRSTVSPFKRPRNSRFTTPLNINISAPHTGSSILSPAENQCCRTRVSSHYPFMCKRKSFVEFLGGPPTYNNLVSDLRHLPEDVKHINADNADQYKLPDESGFNRVGPEAFQKMLLTAGASLSYASKEWVANHYKCIVWKLASFERCYPARASGKFLTVPTVLEELKYRYEREFNYGHRSALKEILEGDASAGSMMILCVSAIRTCYKQKIGEMDSAADTSNGSGSKKLNSLRQSESTHAAKIELTDGWYSLDACLDVPLSKQLLAGKLFVGQKLRVWGAGLCGWVGPVTPLEASKTVNLLIHINGTYRAHWADRLGFCKDLGAPLAFGCIRGAGGKVPRTLVGVTRIYPVLYKERFPDGGSVVRPETAENKAFQLYSQRRSSIAEDIMSKQQDRIINVIGNEEGANIFKMLENSVEPEMVMADMSSEQLVSFSSYQARLEAIRQSDMQKKIEKALEDAGLSSREVTPFVRLRVVGLISEGSYRKRRTREGFITIWNLTEKQKIDLVEGKIYIVTGLMPLNFGADIIYLQGRGPSTTWKALTSMETEKFEPFFTPRKSLSLSNLGEMPLASEFDLAAVIVNIGEVYISGCQKKQWIFVADGSRCGFELEDVNDCLLAISFCSPVMTDNDSSPVLNHCLSGTAVGFCNIVKRARDQTNHLWVAEATETSMYTVCYNIPQNSHLKEAANFAQKWAKESSLTIQILRERALCIISGGS